MQSGFDVKIREIERRRLEATYGGRELDVTSDLATCGWSTSPVCGTVPGRFATFPRTIAIVRFGTQQKKLEADERVWVCENENPSERNLNPKP